MKKVFMILVIILLVFGVLLSSCRDEKTPVNKEGRVPHREKNDVEEAAEEDVDTERVEENDLYYVMEGIWYPLDSEDPSTYTLYADGDYEYNGCYEMDGSVYAGEDTPGRFTISEDEKEIEFTSIDGAVYYGYLDEKNILHIGNDTYIR